MSDTKDRHGPKLCHNFTLYLNDTLQNPTHTYQLTPWPGRLGPCYDYENHDEEDDGAPGWRTRRCKERWVWQFCLWSPRQSPPIGAIGTPDGEDNDDGDDNAIGTPADGDYDIGDGGADDDIGDDGDNDVRSQLVQ